MYRRLAVIAISVSAVAASIFALGADAATRAPIRTYTERVSLQFTGIGAEKGFYSRERGSEKVALSPHLALASAGATSYRLDGVVHNASGQTDIVGNRKYTRNGHGRWTVSTLSAKALATWARVLNPYASLAKFDALPRIRRVSSGRYRASGAVAKTGPFVIYEFGLASHAFMGSGIKTLTIDLVLDAGGRPVKFTVAGRSATEVLTAAETFTNYNKPVKISPP